MRFLFAFVSMCVALFWASAPAEAGNFSADDVKTIIKDFGPIMLLNHSEKYKMDDPDALLDTGKTVFYYVSIQDYPDYVKFKQQTIESKTIQSSAAFGKFKFNDNCRNESQYTCDISIPDSLISGNQQRAARLVSVSEQGDDLYLYFWFFYPFNGPGRSFINPAVGPRIDVKADEEGRHYGDWEHVTLRVSKIGTTFKLTGLFLSRHDFSPWFSDLSNFDCVQESVPAGSPTLSTKKACDGTSGAHPIIYVAINSHAHYPKEGDFVYHVEDKGAFEIEVYDTARGNGDLFDTSLDSNRKILASNVQGFNKTSLSWYDYPYRWGQFIYNKVSFDLPVVPVYVYAKRGVDRGPEGPIAHGSDQLQFAGGHDSLYSLRSGSRVDMLALTFDSNLTCCTLQYNTLDGTWQGWKNKFHGSPYLQSVVGASYKGVDHLFGVGIDGKLYHNSSSNGWKADWNEPSLNIVEGYRLLATGVTASAGQTVNLELFGVRKTDGKLVHAWYNGTSWTGWYPGNPSGMPDNATSLVTARLGSTLALFAVDATGTLYETEYNGSTWTSAVKSPGNAPKLESISIASGNTLELIALGADSYVYHAVYKGQGQWENWSRGASQGDAFRSFPSKAKYVSLLDDGNIEAFIIDDDGTLHHSWRDNSWHGWDSSGDSFPKTTNKFLSIKGVPPGSGNTEVFAVTEQNDVDHTWLTGRWNDWQRMFFDGSAQLRPR